MKTIIRSVVILLLLNTLSFAQLSSKFKIEPIKSITGNESISNQNINVSIIKDNASEFTFMQGATYYYEFHLMDNIANSYDYQSNGSPQQVWYDVGNPGFVHAIFTNSQDSPPVFTQRNSLYFGSTNHGANWYLLGPVPYNSRSGFPSISGTSTGRAVVANHSDYFDLTQRTGIFIDNSPFEYNFSAYDPGIITWSTGPIWARSILAQDDRVVFVSSTNAYFNPDSFHVNTLNPGTGNFSGWDVFDGSNAEEYSLAKSEGGKIGLAFNGQPPNNDGDVYYSESTDNGLTWSSPLKIFDRPDAQDTSMGSFGGLNLNFHGEQPCVVFRNCMQIFSINSYFPSLPSEILFWSPNINGGFAKVIADSNLVPYAPFQGPGERFTPVCNPVIGRTEVGGFLFVAFSVSTEFVWPDPTTDQTTYFAGYFMLSSDGGDTWSIPEKFTPDAPLHDWRYISMAPVNPVFGNDCIVHMVIQGDTIPGSNIYAVNMPLSITARYYHVSVLLMDLIPVELTSFTASVNQSNVTLNWATATELNNQGFEIERASFSATPSQVWEKIGFVTGSGTTTELRSYSFVDRDLEPGIYSYRLKQIDYDGTFEYSEEVEVEINSLAPTEFTLEQNYPNPFNPVTIINYNLPAKSLVTLKVYNLLGEEVRRLVNEVREAGNYEVEFDAASLPSGIYLYRLNAGEYVTTKKMLLLK